MGTARGPLTLSPPPRPLPLPLPMPRLTRGWLMDTVLATITDTDWATTATGATDTATLTPTATTATTARGPLTLSPPPRPLPLPPLRLIRGTDITDTDTVWATVATMADTVATTVWATVATGARSKKAKHKRADTKTPASCFLHQ